MAVVYEIWDLDSGNRLGEFDSRDEALAEVKHALAQHGEAYVATLLLDAEDDQGHTHLIAEGADLVSLARGPAAPAANGTAERLIRSVTHSKPNPGPKAKPPAR